MLVRSVKSEGPAVASALEERAVPARTCGAAAYFQRAEVRDVLAWLRALADPGDSGAVVRALSRPPIELRSVDVARLTQLARRRKLDMPRAVVAALEGRSSEEGRDRARAFLRLYRSASGAFEDRRPDAFVLRLIERIGLRRQQVFATRPTRSSDCATSPSCPSSPRRTCAASHRPPRGLHALPRGGRVGPARRRSRARRRPAVQVMTMHAAKGLEFDHVFVLGLSAARMPDRSVRRPTACRTSCCASGFRQRASAHDAEMRRLLHVADDARAQGPRARLVETASRRDAAALAVLRGGACGHRTRGGAFEEELFGPPRACTRPSASCATSCSTRSPRVGGLGEMRLDTYLDVDQAVSRYIELIKVAALIERAKEGQSLETALSEVNEILVQCATPEQREILRGVGARRLAARHRARPRRPPGRRRQRLGAVARPVHPRRGRGLMLSASDIDTYRICPLKYKFARVFRIPQEPTIHQRFGIVVHQVLERFHPGRRLARAPDGAVRGLVAALGLRRLRRRAAVPRARGGGARALLGNDRQADAEPVWFERSFAFRLGPHLLRGRVDRVDRHPDGTYELIDYKTGKAKTEDDLREDVQLSLYQMGARESWRLETSRRATSTC